MTGATIDIQFADVEAEQQFLETYLPDAFDRYTASTYWDQGWYWPYGQFASYDVGVDGGRVRLVFDGAPEQLLEAEADQWESFDGLTNWELTPYDEEGFASLLDQQIEAKGTVGGEWEYRYKPLTAELALAYHQEFNEPLPPAPEATEENPIGIGLFSLLHSLVVKCGYDWYAENDAYLEGLRSRIKSLAMYRGETAAREEYERIQAELTAFEAELEEWLAAQSTGTASI